MIKIANECSLHGDNFEILSGLYDAYELGRSAGMNKDELKEYLKNNLRVEAHRHNNGLWVTLILEDEVISESGVAID